MKDTRTMRTLLSMSHRLGGPRLWDLVRGGRVKILMYHGVPVREHFEGVENHWRYNVPLREFRAQLEHVARRCHVVSLSRFLAGEGLSRSRTNVVLTFDDGYANNYTNAWPVLRELGLPAVFAVTTGFVLGRQPLWNDVVEHAVQTSPARDVRVSWSGEEHAFDLGSLDDVGDPGGIAGRLQLYNWALRTAVTAGPERDRFLETLIETLAVDASPEAVFAAEDYRPMEPAQVRELASAEGIEIASHSIDHHLLAGLPRDAMRVQLRRSRDELEELTGRPCTSLCLPGGSYDDAVLAEAAAAGYTCVLTSDVGPARAEARTLDRHGVFSSGSLARFVDELHGPVHPLLRATGRARRALRTWRAS